MVVRFKYLPFRTEPSPTIPDGSLHRPMIPIRVIGPVTDWAMFAFVDTGADETTLPRSIGDRVGATIDETVPLPVTGIGGQTLQGFSGDIHIEVRQGAELYRWRQRVRFASFARPEDEITILGHVGFLNYFTATFNGKKREITLKANGTFPK